MKKFEKSEKETPPKFVEGVDFYFENNLMVLTKHFLEKRGYCCHNACRNCPYPKQRDKRL